MPPVFDQWAKYYDLAEADRSVFIDFYGALVTPETQSFLELGCGTGVITTALARRIAEQHTGDTRIRVTGLDVAREMLKIAQERDPQIEWVLGDFREPPVSGEYDLIICCFNVLQMMLHEPDISSVFRAARRLLKPDGQFAFDLYQPNLAYLAQPQKNRLVRAVSDRSGKRFELREDAVYDPESLVYTLDWRLIDLDNPGSPLATMHYYVRQYFASDIERLLADAGLAIEQRYGDFDRSEFTSSSKKQIIVCRRAP